MNLEDFTLLLLILGFLNSPTAADVDVSCDVGASCVLPCSFQAGSEEVIHWILDGTALQVHSYYYGTDQLELQDSRFAGRTSLFKDQLTRGNASLRLTAVAVGDQGRYKCYCSTIVKSKDSFINLSVNAPVKTVDMELKGNVFTCRSEGIYPEPELTWSTDAPSDDLQLQEPSVSQNQEQLYEVSSFLTLAPDSYQSISCTVKTRRNKKTVTYLKERSIPVLDKEMTLQCGVELTPQTSLTWTFNHSQVILTQKTAGSPSYVSEDWRPYVKNDSEPSILEIKDFSSSLEGVYTCEVRNDEETRISNTALRESQDMSRHTTAIIVAVIATALTFTILGLALLWIKLKGKNKRKSAPSNKAESESLNRS